MAISLLPCLNPDAGFSQSVRILVNGEPVAEWAFVKGEKDRRELVVPRRLIPGDGTVLLGLEIAHPINLKFSKQRNDAPILGLCLCQIEVY